MLRELAGVKWSVERWKDWFKGRSLLVVCDNASTVFALDAGWSRGPLRRRLLGAVIDALVDGTPPMPRRGPLVTQRLFVCATR